MGGTNISCREWLTTCQDVEALEKQFPNVCSYPLILYPRGVSELSPEHDVGPEAVAWKAPEAALRASWRLILRFCRRL